jgi:hypothetical protein
MSPSEKPWNGTEWFLGFNCDRCGASSKHVPCRNEGLKLLVRCPSCESMYLATGSLRLGLAFAVTFGLVIAFVVLLFLPKVAAGVVSPWVVVAVAALVSLPLTMLAKPTLARWLVRYQYCGQAT